MAEPIPTAALNALEQAAGSLAFGQVDPKAHDAWLVKAMDALNQFYLFTDSHGTVYPLSHQIYRLAKVTVLGDLPGAVGPLLAWLRANATEFDKHVDQYKLSMPVSEEKPWANWKARLAFYEQVLVEEAAKGVMKRSDRLYREVTGPLLQGRFPKGISYPGIVPQPDPTQHKPPDVITPITTWYVTAYFNAIQRPVDQLLGEWDTGITQLEEDLREFLQALVDAAIKNVVEPVKQGLGWLLAVGAFLGGAWLLSKVLKPGSFGSDADDSDADDGDDGDPNSKALAAAEADYDAMGSDLAQESASYRAQSEAGAARYLMADGTTATLTAEEAEAILAVDAGAF